MKNVGYAYHILEGCAKQITVNCSQKTLKDTALDHA